MYKDVHHSVVYRVKTVNSRLLAELMKNQFYVIFFLKIQITK